MKVLCFSSFTLGYLNRARVLFKTIREHHPDWRLVAVITDTVPPDLDILWPAEPFDEVVWAHELDIPNFSTWLFKHNVVEACTAVKGPYLKQACALDYDAVMYFDPDTALLGPVTAVVEALERAEIVLTPHQLTPDSRHSAVRDNEIGSLKHGIYNLGFLAVRTTGSGLAMADWWNERLLNFCYDDIPSGLFVDQRWCDHVPGLFDNVAILRDPGYNVASWNLSNRQVSVSRDGEVLVNDRPLAFWHFTKLGEVGDTMTRRYAENNFEVYEIWRWYKDRVAKETVQGLPKGWWTYGVYSDGTPIPDADRVAWRGRPDLHADFPNPFAAPAEYLKAQLRS